jgi:glycosyltransferase involved in cell wall biosynthesis
MRPRVICVINEDWFFRSHFLPWAQAAVAGGFEVTVVAARGEAAAAIEAAGIGFVASEAARGGVRPRGIWAAARQVAALVDPGRPTILHAFGLHGMAITALARRMRRPAGTVVSVTGRGFLAAGSRTARLGGTALTRGLARALDGPSTLWLTENPEDERALGLGRDAAGGRLVRLTGAGVDLAAFQPAPMPARPPLRLILVARMIRSKGADLAVAALAMARGRGVEATLTLVGAPDPGNPGAWSPAEISGFAASPGVACLGARADVAALLAGHHVFILPSRGGEGLPKSLLEAAAAGRPAIVTDVPGCRDLVRHGETGWIAPPGDVGGLAAAIAAAAEADLDAMGTAARASVAATADIADIASRVCALYRQLASR